MTYFRKRKTGAVFALTTAILASSLYPTGHVGAAVGSTMETIQGQVTQVQSAKTSDEKIAEWNEWAKDHAYRLDSIQPVKTGQEPDSFSDLNMLKPLLYDKRIVFLGESSHGVAEFNLAKTRLIQFLHQEMGYNVLAFESGLSNTSLANATITQQSPEHTMKNSIFGVWWSKEITPLFDYLKANAQTEQPLILTGFDMQLQFPLLDGNWLKDQKLAKRLAQTEQKLSEFSAGTDLKAYRAEKNEIIQVYKDVLQSLKSEANQTHLQKEYPNQPKLAMLLERSLNDRIRVAREYVDLSIRSMAEMNEGKLESFIDSMEWRDQAMHDNLMWLATEVYPNEKFIVWGHNDHIRKAQSEVMGSPYPIALMGEKLSKEMKQSSYVIGLYASSGQTADNARELHAVEPAEPGSIEGIMSATNAKYSFLDMRYQSRETGNSWMFEPRFAYSWGIYPESFVPRNQYDGILMIDDVHPPQYIRSSSSGSKEKSKE
ncbi:MULTISPECIES: erythromycin esterase family protein [Paenibacillus]|uniref:erythromycin esterase family protein n=1 Tax=Paenibacillus TaxID=44249 RepID=UPI00211AEC73|nr:MULTISPECIES: erythromycin esterase family protein [Paenibacillus]